MRYHILGRTGLRVSELCLGAMTFGLEWGWGADREESRKVFDAFAEAGGNFIDTANNYTNGTSEKWVGEFLQGRRERFVIATKYTSSTRPDDPNGGGNQRKNLVQSLDASLKRLGVDWIDLYWVHAWDRHTPTEEVMRALDDMVRAGKILHAGVSDAPAWVVARAQTIADLRGWTRFSALQIPYSLIERTPERELLPMANEMGLTVTAWGTVGGGILTGKYQSAEPAQRPKDVRYTTGPWADYYLTERNLGIGRQVVAIAGELGVPPSQVAMAWIRQRSGGRVIPIVGARTAAQLRDNLGCLDVRLSDAQMDRLEAVSRIEMGFPHEFLYRVRNIVNGNFNDRIIERR